MRVRKSPRDGIIEPVGKSLMRNKVLVGSQSTSPCYLLVCFFECFKYYKRSLKIVNHLYSLEILLLIIIVMLLLCTTNYIGIICFGLTSTLVILKTFKITKFDK